MSAVKTSRNRQRKTAYAALANQSSRNQIALSGPLAQTESDESEPGQVIAPKGAWRHKVLRRPNPENMNAVGRCETRDSATGRRCDLRKGHDGNHNPRPQGAIRKNGR